MARKTEVHMATPNVIPAFVAKIARLIVPRARPEFTCGDCERWEHCGLVPTDGCIFRAEQLSRPERRSRRSLLSRVPIGPLY
jgi:hypothetical protein